MLLPIGRFACEVLGCEVLSWDDRSSGPSDGSAESSIFAAKNIKIE